MKFWNNDIGTIDVPMAEDENGKIYRITVNKDNPYKLIFNETDDCNLKIYWHVATEIDVLYYAQLRIGLRPDYEELKNNYKCKYVDDGIYGNGK